MDAHSVLADLPASVRGSLKHTNLLKRLDNGPLDTSGGVTVVGRSSTSSVLGTVELGKSTDTDVLPEVDVSGDGSYNLCISIDPMIPPRPIRLKLTCPHVEPVRVVGSQLLLGTGLNNVDPCGDLELAGSLKVGRVGFDEGLGTER